MKPHRTEGPHGIYEVTSARISLPEAGWAKSITRYTVWRIFPGEGKPDACEPVGEYCQYRTAKGAKQAARNRANTGEPI